MYTKRTNASPTSNPERGPTQEDIKLDYDGVKEVDVSRSICYGLTWTPSRDEKLSTKDSSPRSLSPSQSLNTNRINDRKTRYSFLSPYELNQSEDLPKSDCERCLGMRKTFSTRASTTLIVPKDLDSYEYWLSGEKFFETPPKSYNEENDIYAIPTRDKSDNEDVEERTKDEGYRPDDVNLIGLSSPRVYNSDRTLMSKIDYLLKTTKETSDYGDASNKIRRSSSAFSPSQVEANLMKKNDRDSSSRSMIENVTSSHWNVVESVSTLGRANVHNHIYLSSGYLDRYFDIPLSKILKLSRKSSRVRCIRRRILKRPKRSRSRLIDAVCPISSMIEMKSVNCNSGKGRAFPKKSVCDILSEIDSELSAYLKCTEKLRERLPTYVHIETIFTAENKRTLNEVAKRCKYYIANNFDNGEAVEKMESNLSDTLYILLGLVKEVKRALLQEENRYTKLQSVPTLEKQVVQNTKRMVDDAKWYLINGCGTCTNYWKNLSYKLLNDILAIMSDIQTIEDKENIGKLLNRSINDQEPVKRPFMIKLDGKVSPGKLAKRYSIKKENQVDTQMGLLSKARPIVSIGKFKVPTKDQDGYKDRIKIKDIGDQRDRILKENEHRATRQSLAKPRRSVHTVWSNSGNRGNTGVNVENPKVIKDRRNNNAIREKDNTTTSPTNADCRRKRQNAYNAPQPVWKPGGAFKSVYGSTSSVLHAEQPIRRSLNVACDKENPDHMRSSPVKHANPSEPTACGKNILGDSRKNENFREERVSRLCNLIARSKMKKGSKDGANVLSETRSSTNTQSGVPLSDTSGTKIGVKSSQVNLSRQSSGSKPRPGVHRSNNYQRNTRTPFEAKIEPLPLKMSPPDKLERNDSPTDFPINLNAKNEIEHENVWSKPNLKKSTTSDTAKSSLILVNDEDKLENTLSPKTTDDELAKNTSQTNSISSNPQKSPMTTINSDNTVNVDYDLRSESRQSFVLLADASCNAEFSSTSNSTTMVPSSKFCQVSLSSTSSRTSFNYDRPYDKDQSIDTTPTVDKDSLESSTDDESNYQTALGFDPRKQKNKHKLSLNSLKDFLHGLGLDAELIQKVETKYQLKKSNETSPSNLSQNLNSSLVKTSNEPDDQSPKMCEFKTDYNRSTESIGSLDDSINVSTEKIDETIIEREKSKSSQTISNLKEFCDACTNAEDIKSDCSTHVDATVSCDELGLKTSSKDVSTEIFDEDKSILSPRRMVETQTNPRVSPADSVVELGIEQEEKKDYDLSMETEDSECEKPNYENGDNKTQQENNQEKSSDCLLNSKDSITIDESPLSQCLIHQLEDIKEKLQNVDAQLNKLQEPAKETSDAFAQINTITSSTAAKSVGISTTPMTSGISKESSEEFNMDFMKTRENRISSDIINAFHTMEWYASNWNEALRMYKENSSTKRFEENWKDSTCGSSSDEAVNLPKMAEFINASCQFDNDDFYRSCGNEETELDSGKSSRFFEGLFNVLNEPKISDVSDESDDTESFAYYGLEDFYEVDAVKPISQKSSRSSVFFETQDEIDKVQSSVDIEDRSSARMKHSERIQVSNVNEEEQDVHDPQEFVLSREALLLLTYLTVCAFVFCCLKFSMTCESLIL